MILHCNHKENRICSGMDFKYYSVKEINAFLTAKGLAVNKKFGQNFLINSGVCDTIVRNLELTPNDVVFEIGCGLGSLTNRLIDSSAAKVVGFEIDNAYQKHLQNIFRDSCKFTLVAGDFLKEFENAVKTHLAPGQQPVITGNLPYYITTPIMEKIFTATLGFSRAAFMMQKEVGERVVSKAGNKKYGSLSIFCQYYSEPKIIANISPASFYPQPNVNSVVLRFVHRTYEPSADNEQLFFAVARSLFINRRKQLKNNFALSPFLKSIPLEHIFQAMEQCAIAPEERGENLSIEQIIHLSNVINKLNSESKI